MGDHDTSLLNGNDVSMEVKSDKQEMNTVVKRRHFTQSNFNLLNNYEAEKLTVRQKVRGKLRQCCKPSYSCCKSLLLSFFPFVGILRKYSIRNDLLGDIVSGLTVGVMHIPQGMAYGMLANLDPVYGLYTSFFPVILYFFLGTSRHISLGTFAVVSLMLGVVVDKSDCHQYNSASNQSSVVNNETLQSRESLLYNNTQDGSPALDSRHEVLMCKVGYVMAVSMLAGIYQFFMGLFRFGFVTIYLLDPLTRALTSGAAVHVFTSQIRHVFGIDTGRFQGPLRLIYTYEEFFKYITRTNVASLVMAIICIIFIYCVQRWLSPIVKRKFRVPLPVELTVLIFGTLISTLAKFSSPDVFRMKVVGNIPTGFPVPSFPPVNRFAKVAGDAVGIAIVSFTINISMAKLFARKHGYRIKANQELMAYGIINFICSNLNCYIATASLSRSVLQESVGGKTQVAGLVSCCLLLIVLLAVGPLFRDLPNCVLAAIIIVNLRGIFLQITDLPKLLKISVIDALIWLVTFLAVVLTDVDLGLFIGVGFALLSVVFRTQRVHTCILGRISKTEVYEDIKKYASAKEIEGVKIFRFCSSLCYTNTDYFMTKIFKKSLCNPVEVKAARISAALQSASPKDSEAAQPMKEQENEEQADDRTRAPFRHLIIDCSSVVFVDAVGVTTLNQVVDNYTSIGIQMSFARCNDRVYELLKTSVCISKDKKGNVKIKATVYPTIHDAVMAAMEKDIEAQNKSLNDHGSVAMELNHTSGASHDHANGDAIASANHQATSEM